MINLFHVINSQHGGKLRKHRGCSPEVQNYKTQQLIYGTWQGREKQLLDCWKLYGGRLGDLWCPHTNSQLQFCGLPFGFLCLCMLAQSSLFPKGSDAHTPCRIALDLWNASVGNKQRKKKITFAKQSHISIKITPFLFNPQINNPNII